MQTLRGIALYSAAAAATPWYGMPSRNCFPARITSSHLGAGVDFPSAIPPQGGRRLTLFPISKVTPSGSVLRRGLCRAVSVPSDVDLFCSLVRKRWNGSSVSPLLLLWTALLGTEKRSISASGSHNRLLAVSHAAVVSLPHRLAKH